MRQQTDNEQLLMSYLFGDLPEEERLRIEERFFTDSEFYEQLLALEDEIRYDYAQGELSELDRKRFERRFMATSEGRRQAELARAVTLKIADAAAQATPLRTRKESGEWWKLRVLRNPAAQFSLAFVALAFLVCCAWLIYETVRLRGQVQQLQARQIPDSQGSPAPSQTPSADQQLKAEFEREQSRRAELEKELADLKAASSNRSIDVSEPASLSIELKPGMVRDTEGRQRLRLAPGLSRLQIRLDIRAEGDYKSYRATLQTAEGEEIWSQSRLKALRAGSGKTVVLGLDASLFTAGDYVITLKGASAGGELEEVGDYYLSITRK
jgi:hypothetical protein